MRMKPLAAIVALLALAGCATAPETRVTRFHLDQPIARGEMTVEPLVPADRDSLAFQTYASIVGAELARIGFTEAPGLRQSEQVAVLSIERGARETMRRRAPVTVGIGGGNYGGGVGVGGGISFPVGRRQEGGVAVTRLSVQIRRRSEGTVVWEGRAETTGPATADAAVTVKALAAALFRDFPGESGRTVVVK